MKRCMKGYASLLFTVPLFLFSSCKCEAQIVKGAKGGIVVEHTGYTVSFNSETKIPNWVAYELTAEKVAGTVKRDNGYYPDPDIKAPQADNNDYRSSGWDRGHMAPAGDMKWSKEAMHESCYFTNICPQNRNLNAGDWNTLENKCRSWAQRYGSVQIVCGPIVGEMKQGTLGDNHVAIPDAFYKVLLVKMGEGYEGVGYVFENKAGHRALNTYAMSIDEVEALTGYDFFHSLPDKLERMVEAEVHQEVWK